MRKASAHTRNNPPRRTRKFWRGWTKYSGTMTSVPSRQLSEPSSGVSPNGPRAAYVLPLLCSTDDVELSPTPSSTKQMSFGISLRGTFWSDFAPDGVHPLFKRSRTYRHSQILASSKLFSQLWRDTCSSNVSRNLGMGNGNISMISISDADWLAEQVDLGCTHAVLRDL